MAKVTTGVDASILKGVIKEKRKGRAKRGDSNEDSDWRLSQMYNWSESETGRRKLDARRGLAY